MDLLIIMEDWLSTHSHAVRPQKANDLKGKALAQLAKDMPVDKATLDGYFASMKKQARRFNADLSNNRKPTVWPSILWTLDPVWLTLDWRLTKNAERDLKKWQTLAVFEAELVKTYRKNMLDNCGAAALMRQKVKDLFSEHNHRRSISNPKTRKAMETSEYMFLDGIKSSAAWKPRAEDMHAEIEQVIASRKTNRMVKVYDREITDIVKFVERKKVFRSAPYDQGIDRSVDKAFREFIEVLCIYHSWIDDSTTKTEIKQCRGYAPMRGR